MEKTYKTPLNAFTSILHCQECLVQEGQNSQRVAKSPDLSFTFLQTEDIKHGADFSTASLKVILNIFREVHCILSFSKKKNPGESTETTLGERHEPVMDRSGWHNTMDLLSNSISSQFPLDLFQCVQRGLHKSYFHSSEKCSTSWPLTF